MQDRLDENLGRGGGIDCIPRAGTPWRPRKPHRRPDAAARRGDRTIPAGRLARHRAARRPAGGRDLVPLVPPGWPSSACCRCSRRSRRWARSRRCSSTPTPDQPDRRAGGAGPDGAADHRARPGHRAVGAGAGRATATALVSVALSLFWASRGVDNLVSGINMAHAEVETRNLIRRNIVSLWLTAVLTVMALASLAVAGAVSRRRPRRWACRAGPTPSSPLAAGRCWRCCRWWRSGCSTARRPRAGRRAGAGSRRAPWSRRRCGWRVAAVLVLRAQLRQLPAYLRRHRRGGDPAPLHLADRLRGASRGSPERRDGAPVPPRHDTWARQADGAARCGSSRHAGEETVTSPRRRQCAAAWVLDLHNLSTRGTGASSTITPQMKASWC